MTIQLRVLIACAGGALVLCGCASEVHLSRDFGFAIRQDEAAQIANPDARYTGTPTPGSDGVRNAAAETRYQKDEVIPPTSLSSTSAITSTGNAGQGQPPAGGAATAGPQ
jgi:hypothetical protein